MSEIKNRFSEVLDFSKLILEPELVGRKKDKNLVILENFPTMPKIAVE